MPDADKLCLALAVLSGRHPWLTEAERVALSAQLPKTIGSPDDAEAALYESYRSAAEQTVLNAFAELNDILSAIRIQFSALSRRVESLEEQDQTRAQH